ncbi:MAG: DEAD/DEAH box helicase family protein [Winogradskyella sp.]
MAKLKTLIASYYQRYEKELKQIVSDYQVNKTALFSTSEFSIFNSLEDGITKHQLRYYQMNALYVLDYLFSTSQAELDLNKKTGRRISPLIKDLLDKTAKGEKAPYIGYEMATGSGKTMLMGASIYLLNKKHGIDNFLIITPPAKKDIYHKTVRNFTSGNFESVWADDSPFKYNLITGDNYQQNLFTDSNVPNIFIFNMDKFGANATNTEKAWESAIWKDEDGNTIGIKQFLQDKKLVIITDEAHHAQSKGGSGRIIKNFHPLSVIEFTATAVENNRDQEKKNQTIAFKYDIRSLLEDGHGKLVRAIALATPEKVEKSKTDVPQSERLKLITLFLIHLIKKKSVLLDEKAKGLKPISFVKVKDDTKYTQIVFDYIKNELSNDIDNLNIILDKIAIQDLEIINLIKDLLESEYQNDISKISKDIQDIAETSIFYHGKSDKETEKKFNEIRTNEVELVVYMQKLDEGIDLPNIYAMAVINDTDTEFKTSVKQIIGRGVRLNKEKREFDDIDDVLLQQAERLHIVCDKGKNFEEQIQAIQKEFGLIDKYLSYEREKKQVNNNVKSHLLDGKYLPHIKADFKVKEVNGQKVSLVDLITNTDAILESFTDDNCFSGESDEIKRFVKYKPSSFFVEVDVFADKKEYHHQIQNAGGKPKQLILGNKDAKSILGHVTSQLYCLPDTDFINKQFQVYMNKLNVIGLQYYHISDSDEELVRNHFRNTFSFFYRNYIEKRYFRLDFKPIFAEDSWNLKKQFTETTITIPIDQIENKDGIKLKDKTKLIELIKEGYNFYGYDNNIYDYSKFDSYTEKKLADYFDIITNENNVGLIPFWIKNDRQIHFSYGSKKYFPDFIVLYKDMLYVVEGKGEKFFDNKKSQLLEKLNEAEGNDIIKKYNGIMVLDSYADVFDEGDSWNDFVENAKTTFDKFKNSLEVESTVDEELKYKTYLPLYTPKNAHRRFYKKQSKVKISGWVKVPEKDYPNTVIAIKVIGGLLNPKYNANDLILIDTDFKLSQIEDKIGLIYNNSIKDYYEPEGYTVRKLNLKQEKGDSLFGSYTLELSALHPAFPKMTIDNITSENQLEVIGVEYQE